MTAAPPGWGLAAVEDFSAARPHAFVKANAAAEATAKT